MKVAETFVFTKVFARNESEEIRWTSSVLDKSLFLSRVNFMMFCFMKNFCSAAFEKDDVLTSCDFHVTCDFMQHLID